METFSEQQVSVIIDQYQTDEKILYASQDAFLALLPLQKSGLIYIKKWF